MYNPTKESIMKKRNLLPLVLLLAACGTGGNSNSKQVYSDELTEDMLDALKTAYDFTATVSKTTAVNDNYQTKKTNSFYKISSQANGTQYSFQKYEEKDDIKSVSEDKIVGSLNVEPEGIFKYAAQVYLGIDNEIHRDILHYADGSSLRFGGSGFDEGFQDLYSEIITKGDAKREFVVTVLNDDDRANLEALGHGLIGDFSAALKSLTLYTDGYKVTSFVADYKPYAADSSTQITYHVEGNFNVVGEGVKVKEVKPFDEVGENKLTKAFSKLKDYNFTENTKYYSDGVLSGEVDVKVNQNVIDYHQYNWAYGQNATLHKAYYQEGSKVMVAREINGDFYQYGTGYKDKNMSSFLPSMQISAAVFDENSDGTYSIKKVVPSISPSTIAYNVFSFSNVDDLTIKIEDSKITLTNVGIDFKEETVITNIGTTNVSIDTQNVKEDCSSLTWKDLFFEQEEAYDALVDYVKDESILSLIPTLGGTCPVATLGVDSKYREFILPIGYTPENAQVNLTDYINKLVDYGWTTIMENLYGGYSIYRESSVTTAGGVTVSPYLDLFITSSADEYIVYIYLYLE